MTNRSLPSNQAPAIPVTALVMPGPAVTSANAFELQLLSLKYSTAMAAVTS